MILKNNPKPPIRHISILIGVVMLIIFAIIGLLLAQEPSFLDNPACAGREERMIPIKGKFKEFPLEALPFTIITQINGNELENLNRNNYPGIALEFYDLFKYLVNYVKIGSYEIVKSIITESVYNIYDSSDLRCDDASKYLFEHSSEVLSAYQYCRLLKAKTMLSIVLGAEIDKNVSKELLKDLRTELYRSGFDNLLSQEAKQLYRKKEYIKEFANMYRFLTYVNSFDFDTIIEKIEKNKKDTFFYPLKSLPTSCPANLKDKL